MHEIPETWTNLNKPSNFSYHFLVKAKEFYYLLTKISTDIDYRLKLMASRLVIVLQSLFLLTFALLANCFRLI